MAAKNDEQRNEIYETAIALFKENGYFETTYKSIADACGTTKSRVQYYFPQKELLVNHFFSKHIEEIGEKAQDLLGETAHESLLEVFCLMGILHFGHLVENPEMKKFADDIVKSRALTQSIIDEEKSWARRRLGESEFGDSEEIADALTVALGGAYELIYQAICEDKDITPIYIERMAFLPFAISIGATPEEIEEAISICADMIV